MGDGDNVLFDYILTRFRSLCYDISDTGCFLMIKGKYELITPSKMSPYKVKLDAKFH